jgi:hypothetical protein
VDCGDLPLLGGSHGVHRAAKLEVVEAAGSNRERGRGGEGCGVAPGGLRGGGIALSIIVRQLPYVPLSFLRRRSLHCRLFRVFGELAAMAVSNASTYRKRAHVARGADT